MNKRIILVHGIRTHGDDSIDRLDARLTELGHTVDQYEYPKRRAIQVYLPSVRRHDAAALVSFMRPGDHVIAHSYGGLIWQEAIKLGAKWSKCFLFSPAATSDKFKAYGQKKGAYPRSSFDELHVVYNPEDKALEWGALMPFHPFGKLGYRGYAGPQDDRIRNVRGFATGHGRNHSHYFQGDRLDKWVSYIDSHLR